ncbi:MULTISPECIES: arylesterase [Rhizobium]|jgi:acyl-CoA thioesterase-1|uniref:arylesterase n=1 Tax=Rhizobium TaxID=379 RepID=UPI00056670FE|nr:MULTISPECIES: arylesterase [Rhizobium]NKJ06180.1 acyl-CoA thioesterase-1 [Rhizobium sp. SG741]NKJ38296.1 acyl-CoA thioesterase-1 [Rhizobium sp. SG570]NRP88783.1 Arylesterase [Ensifer adhaerens]NTJ08652.1 arylesterase [Rhizobium lusitanum]
MSFKVAAFHFAVITFGLLFGAVDAAEARTIQLVGLGDSLMAGYQLPPGDGFPAKLEAALKAKGLDVAVADAGVSGDTTSGGLSRVDWSVPDGTDGVILELGANDALRGIPPEQTEKNLETMIGQLKQRKIPVLLVGMLAPPNMGADYAEKFNPIYKRLADKYQLALYPFFLDGVATHADLQLSDGMHPNPKGVDVMVERILPAIVTFVGMIDAGAK